jgi:hypothetical protein
MPDRVTQLTRTRPVPNLVAGSLLVLTLVSLVQTSLAETQGGKTQVFFVQTTAPAAVFIKTAENEVELRRQLRAQNGVSALSPAISVIRLSIAPIGSFGFITPKLLGMALITRSPDLSIEQIPPVSNSFEIHKLADGSGMLVGFVEANVKSQLTASERLKSLRFGLYSNPSIKAPHIIAVPLAKLAVDRMPVRLDPKEPGSTVLLEIDLPNADHVSWIAGRTF